MTYDYVVRFIVLGEVGVGKSSVLLRFAKNEFYEHLASTIIDIYHSDILVRNKRVLLELWDTAGQERYHSLVKNYFRKADGVLLVYDVTDIASFQKLTSWFLELKSENEEAVPIIVGNKIDDPNGSSVAVNSVRRFAEEQNLRFYESSAKTGENVKEIFEDLTEQVLEVKETISRGVPLPPSDQNVYPAPTNLGPPSGSKIEELKKSLNLHQLIAPLLGMAKSTPHATPSEPVVKLHETTTPVQSQRGCCG